MILEEETYAEYGYYPRDLKHKSGKKILAVCDDCGKVRVTSKHKYRSLCRSCVRKGKRSPHWKGGKVKRICDACGNEFEANASKIIIGSGRFCSLSCAKKGENNPKWNNWASFEPYCEKFDEPFREYIREKFGRVCFLCGKTEADNGRRLDVHHVNYNKDCGCDGDLTCQFVPLCRSCNSKVNFSRKEWTEKIMNMLHNSLKGWYI